MIQLPLSQKNPQIVVLISHCNYILSSNTGYCFPPLSKLQLCEVPVLSVLPGVQLWEWASPLALRAGMYTHTDTVITTTASNVEKLALMD